MMEKSAQIFTIIKNTKRRFSIYLFISNRNGFCFLKQIFYPHLFLEEGRYVAQEKKDA